MRKILALALLFQGMVIATLASSDDKDELGRLSDVQFSNSKEAFFVNDVFIKSTIGIDFGKMAPTTFASISKETLKEPLVINGVSYTHKLVFYIDKKFNFLSLEDIRKEYCPDVKGASLYMINKFFIANDVASYKIDKNFILKTEVLPSSEIEFFKGQTPFTIIRIFTNTADNNYPMRIQ